MNKLENLSQFTGTENHYRNKNYPFLYTDGIKGGLLVTRCDRLLATRKDNPL